jgi:hypothetical protein
MEAAKDRHGAEVDRALLTPSQDVTAGLAEAQAEFMGEYSCIYHVVFLFIEAGNWTAS